MKSSFSWRDSDNRAHIVALLKEGSVIVGTSDTVIGLLADTSEKGFFGLNTIKGRVDKPYVILMGGLEKLSYFAEMASLTDEASIVAHACWPGPLTLVVRGCPKIPSYLKAADGTIALRVPNHGGLLAILPHFNGLFSTSANITGQPIPQSLAAVESSIIEAVAACIVDGEINLQPSTIIDCTGKELRVLREGAYSLAALEKVMGKKIVK